MRRLIPLFLTAILLLGACGGKSNKDVAARDKGSTTTSEMTTSTEAGAAGGGGATTTAAGKTATTKKSGTSAGGGGSASQPATANGVKATAPGSYTYKVNGTMAVGPAPAGGSPQPVNTTSTMKVDPLQGTDQHSSQSSQNGGSETLLRYQGDGVYLVDLKLTGQISKEFKLEPPGLAFPQPAAMGRTWSWTAKSTDGATSVKSDFKILRTETIAIGSEQVPTVVVEATVTTSGDINSTSKRTMWTSEAYRLIVRQDEKLDGTYSGFKFTADTSSVLQSTKPS
ncbi:MAG: hypothetical protein QOE35_1892 [Actinomycetota bacterium]|jgi:hypothetical protein